MNEWNNLPNAAHIDRILASLKSHPDAWSAASRAAGDAAWGANAALIAWDNSAKYLDISSDQLKVWMHLSDDPAAVLILPAVIALEKVKETEEIS